MSPWQPCARKERKSARAAGATSARAKPTASKPSASARSRIEALRSSDGGDVAGRLLSLEVGNEILQPAARNSVAQSGHELLVEMQIVTAQQDRAKHLPRLEQMMQIGAAVVGAGRAGARGGERPRRGGEGGREWRGERGCTR